MTSSRNDQNPDSSLSRHDIVLYALTVFAWSFSWYALKVNMAGGIPAAVSITWRFGIAAAIMFAWVSLSGGRLRFSAREHIAFAGLGVLLFSSNFILFYQASLLVVSALLAVVFSLASVINLVLGTLRGDFAGPRRWFGALLGGIGIVLLYWPELQLGSAAVGGLALCIAGTLSFCCGNLISQSLQKRSIPVLSASAWGMAYGTLWSSFVATVSGNEFAFDRTVDYIASLIWLIVVSTILAFWAYLSLIGRIGAARASYATVMFPIFALLLSTVMEGYRWSFLSILGVALALTGNLFVLRGGNRARTPVARIPG